MSDQQDPKANDVFASLKDVNKRVADLQRSTVKSYLDALKPVAASQDDKRAYGDMANQVADHTARFWQRSADLTVEYYKNLFDIGRDYLNAVGDAVKTKKDEPQEAEPVAPPPPIQSSP